MMKRNICLLLSISCILGCGITAYAGEWKHENDGRWWYQNDDGGYTVSNWQLIDGKYYYFDAQGYMLSNTVTPDGYQVGADGAWIQDNGQSGVRHAGHSMSNISYGSGSVTDALAISDWSYVPDYFDSTYHIFEITNNSGSTLEISINENAKNSSGEVIGASSVSEEDVPAGCTIFMMNYFSDVSGISSYDTTITTKAEDFYIPVIQNIDVSVTDRNDKAIITVSNRGTQAAEFVEAAVAFFDGDQIVYYSTKYFDNDDYYLTPGASVSEQFNAYSKYYTDVKAHVTGRRSKYSTK